MWLVSGDSDGKEEGVSVCAGEGKCDGLLVVFARVRGLLCLADVLTGCTRTRAHGVARQQWGYNKRVS